MKTDTIAEIESVEDLEQNLEELEADVANLYRNHYDYVGELETTEGIIAYLEKKIPRDAGQELHQIVGMAKIVNLLKDKIGRREKEEGKLRQDGRVKRKGGKFVYNES